MVREGVGEPWSFAGLEEAVAGAAAARGWAPWPLADGFARVAAEVGGETVTMCSRAWSGGKCRLARLTVMASPRRIRVCNLVVYPWPRWAAPLFATDLVVLQDRLRVGVIDALPLGPLRDAAYDARWVDPFRRLGEESAGRFPRFVLRQEWSQHYLGPGACLATDLGAADWPALGALWGRYWQGYLDGLDAAAPAGADRRETVRQWQGQYNRDHAEVELRRNPLVRYYGAAFGARFVHDFLFNDALGGPDPAAPEGVGLGTA